MKNLLIVGAAGLGLYVVYRYYKKGQLSSPGYTPFSKVEPVPTGLKNSANYAYQPPLYGTSRRTRGLQDALNQVYGDTSSTVMR